MCDNAGNKNNRNFNTSFFAVPTPTNKGNNQNIFTLIILITRTTANTAKNAFFLKNFSVKIVIIIKH